MKWLIALLLVGLTGLTSAFSVQTVSDFPTSMYGGGQYSAFYHIDGNAVFPFFSFVNASDDIVVSNSVYDPILKLWKHNITTQDFNITLELPSNLTPDSYNITVQFSGDYNVPDAPVITSNSNSGGGSVVFGYFPPAPTPLPNVTNQTPQPKPTPTTPKETPKPIPTSTPEPQKNASNFTVKTLPIEETMTWSNDTKTIPAAASLFGDLPGGICLPTLLFIVALAVIFIAAKKMVKKDYPKEDVLADIEELKSELPPEPPKSPEPDVKDDEKLSP